VQPSRRLSPGFHFLDSLLNFNSGFYEAIELSQWIAGNPTDVLATNFSKPAALIEKFPCKDVFINDQGDPGK
jgi:oxalate decarboxylase